VLGAGDCSDGFHRTRSAPDGAPIVRTISEAIADAGLTPDLIDCINAHGTSTPENDKMEAMGCAKVFGDRAGQVATTSNKSMIGHTLSAAGAVEAIFSLASIAAQRIPPTINHQLADPAIPLDIVGNVARDARIRTVLSNSFGFGGQNVCLVLAAEPLA
jgi:3-oxoacyl-[acyl-carrier-protein] synthase II